MKDDRFTLRINKQKKELYAQLAKENGYSGLAGLIDDLLELYQRNPNILNPTVEETPLMESAKQTNERLDSMESFLKRIEGKFTLIRGQSDIPYNPKDVDKEVFE